MSDLVGNPEDWFPSFAANNYIHILNFRLLSERCATCVYPQDK